MARLLRRQAPAAANATNVSREENAQIFVSGRRTSSSRRIGSDMLTLSSFWRRVSGRRRRHKSSFYDSQHLMREAAREDASGSLRHLSDEALQKIADAESGEPGREKARAELERRHRKPGQGGAAG